MITERRKQAFTYNEAFKDIDCLRIPLEPNGCFSNFQSYSLYLKKNCKIERNALMQILLDQGIATRRGGARQIADFGIARMRSSETRTQTGVILALPSTFHPSKSWESAPITARTSFRSGSSSTNA